jgi:hypothetical protein
MQALLGTSCDECAAETTVLIGDAIDHALSRFDLMLEANAREAGLPSVGNGARTERSE